jgi:hypothetical protein
VSIAGVGMPAAAELKGWGSVPFGTPMDEARKLLKAENPEYWKAEKAAYEFLRHPAEVGRYTALAVYRFANGRLDKVFLHLKDTGEPGRSCASRYETLKREVAQQVKGEFGKDGDTKTRLSHRMDNSITRADGVLVGVEMNVDGFSTEQPCKLSVSYAPPNKGKSF